MTHFSERWIKYYLDRAQHVSTMSKDPSSQCGCVAIGEDGQTLSDGFNGFPRGIADTEERYNDRPLKYKYVIHSEQNCIYNASLTGVSLKGAAMFVYGRIPVCHECAKAIIQVGVKTVYMRYLEPLNERWAESAVLAWDMFDEAGVEHYEDCDESDHRWNESVKGS